MQILMEYWKQTEIACVQASITVVYTQAGA